ncbi:hypothetical protein RHMOL_Rhmol13G0270800 [Rhododendron molle]|uniref:Uncharacterized protein n=1 Tax=Rhododendron molle TaxID=49168 RepID=A0ACC0LB64_RHOML|nr:hypothetical protein RHMOL_Rhmol13G0270800 [Rhododendron molle]
MISFGSSTLFLGGRLSICQGRLGTMDRLAKWGTVTDSTCVPCAKEDRTSIPTCFLLALSLLRCGLHRRPLCFEQDLEWLHVSGVRVHSRGQDRCALKCRAGDVRAWLSSWAGFKDFEECLSIKRMWHLSRCVFALL